jgi:hypothetical protein
MHSGKPLCVPGSQNPRQFDGPQPPSDIASLSKDLSQWRNGLFKSCLLRLTDRCLQTASHRSAAKDAAAAAPAAGLDGVYSPFNGRRTNDNNGERCGRPRKTLPMQLLEKVHPASLHGCAKRQVAFYKTAKKSI